MATRKERVQNVRRLQLKLKELQQAAELELKPMLAEAATLVTDKQKELVPVLTGALRDSIQWNFGPPPTGAKLGRKASTTTGPGQQLVSITAGDEKAPYAAYVEFGTHRAPAQPYFYAGYRAVKRGIKAIASRSLKEALRRSLRKSSGSS